MTQEELRPVLDALSGYWPWLVHVAAFVGFARMIMKPIGEWLRDFIRRAYERVISTADGNDDHWLESLVHSLPYRIFAFLLDMFCSVKLPLAEDLFKPSSPNQP